jgi:hypothetical protein
MILFAGVAGNTAFKDVWSLSLTGSPTWTQIVTTGNGPPVEGTYWHTAVYDPGQDRMIVFGGYRGGEFPILLNRTYALALSGPDAWTWSTLTPPEASPPARAAHVAIYDPRGRMIVFGGSGYNDVWELSLTGTPTWTPLVPDGEIGIPGLFGETAIYDSVHDRMVVFGGNFTNMVLALSLSGNTTWSELLPAGDAYPSSRYQHAAIYDAQRGDMVAFGGHYAGNNYLNDVWSLDMHSIVSVPGETDAIGSRTKLGALRPNPSREATTVQFEVAAAGRVALDIFDSQGRHVRRIADQVFTSGPHSVSWGGEDDGGLPVRAGLYFVRMKSAEFESAKRIVPHRLTAASSAPLRRLGGSHGIRINSAQ